MSKTLEAIRALPWIDFVDDEREDGSSIIVTLKEGFSFAGDDSGVKGFDTVSRARAGTRKGAVIEG
ncbi:hypothetical protein [Alcaligenes faecalis]|uniref:hypothetical protein n=1 Tax=Alcaligenes faecalis TaxID=511 RepID=UPI0024BCC1D4|nr:hypothetical protein [Alcaligenes faecalis]WHQ45825.1 hypothetical protein E8D21_19375 [Alcaligenes faecalis]